MKSSLQLSELAVDGQKRPDAGCDRLLLSSYVKCKKPIKKVKVSKYEQQQQLIEKLYKNEPSKATRQLKATAEQVGLASNDDAQLLSSDGAYIDLPVSQIVSKTTSYDQIFALPHFNDSVEYMRWDKQTLATDNSSAELQQLSQQLACLVRSCAGLSGQIDRLRQRQQEIESDQTAAQQLQQQRNLELTTVNEQLATLSQSQLKNAQLALLGSRLASTMSEFNYITEGRLNEDHLLRRLVQLHEKIEAAKQAVQWRARAAEIYQEIAERCDGEKVARLLEQYQLIARIKRGAAVPRATELFFQ